MRIQRLALLDVRRHRELELRPAPGLTVVRGPNESGKSTIQVALEMALFRRVTSTHQDTQDAQTWGTTTHPRIELDFEHEGRQGKLVKVFAGPKGTTSLELDGETDTDPTRVDTILAELTGLPSERFFRSTASVRHHELADLDRDEGALRDALDERRRSGDLDGPPQARRGHPPAALRGTQVPGPAQDHPGRPGPTACGAGGW
jgi:DNA repair exonuclease SbcCD ATPase subunit